MTTLILDTSTDLCVVALAKKGMLLSNCLSVHQNHLSKTLLPDIQTLLQRHQLTPSDLDGIALGVGPGSYTGTRLGASVAKTLGFALDIPLYPFLSPLIFVPSQEGSFAFLIETKPGPYFVLTGGILNGKLHQKKAGLVAKDSLEAHVADVDFFILPHSTPLPFSLNEKPILQAAPNLPLITSFLLSVAPMPANEVRLEYLHTPFSS